MKKISFPLLLIFVILFTLWFFKQDSSNQTSLSTNPPQESTYPDNNQLVKIDMKNYPLNIAWIKTESSKVSLFGNLTEKETGRKLKQTKQCETLVNGGFYTREEHPIGVFISEGETLNKGAENALFNGVFSINGVNLPQISSDLSGEDWKVAVQAGPILIKDYSLKKLAIKNDEPERRTVVGLTDTDEVIFLTVFNPTSAYLGPTLEELPNVLQIFQTKTGTKLKDALNLDGGTASAFYSNEISLGELTHIGSYFCIK